MLSDHQTTDYLKVKTEVMVCYAGVKGFSDSTAARWCVSEIKSVEAEPYLGLPAVTVLVTGQRNLVDKCG